MKDRMIFLKYLLIVIIGYAYIDSVLNAHNSQNLVEEYKSTNKYRKTVPVKGYFKKSGTYVPPHWRSPPKRK